MAASWKLVKAVVDGDLFEIDGLNIWAHEWQATGEDICVKDPLYGQSYSMTVYKISHENIEVRFAAGEFSNCVWGIYQEH